MAVLQGQQESEEGRFLGCARRLIENRDYQVVSEILERHVMVHEAEVDDILAGRSEGDVNKARYCRGRADGIKFALKMPELILRSEIKGEVTDGKRRD